MSSKRAAVSVDTEARLVGEISNLDERQAALESRREQTLEALIVAKTERANLLAGDPGTDLGAATRRVRDCEDEIETVDGVLADLREKRSALSAELDAERSRLERVAVAAQLDAIAREVDDNAAIAATALAALGEAARKMVAAIPSDLIVADFPSASEKDNRSHAERLVAVVIADGLADVFPPAFAHVVTRDGGPWAAGSQASALFRAFDLTADRIRLTDTSHDFPGVPLPVSEGGAAAISDRLRSRAAAILAGAVPAMLDDVKPIEPEEPTIDLRSVGIISLRAFTFIGEGGERTSIDAVSSVGVPGPVAEAAIARGFALPFESREGTAAWTSEVARRRMSPNWAHNPPVGPAERATIASPSLGDPCGFLHTEEA